MRTGKTASRSWPTQAGLPWRRVDDRACEVVRERGRLPAVGADRAQGHRGARRRGARARVQRGHRGRAVEAVAVGGAVVLDGLSDDARAGAAGGRIDLQVAVGEGGALIGQPQQARELLVGTQRDQIAARVDPAGQHRHLRGGHRHLAQHHLVEPVQHGRGGEREVERREVGQALRLQDLRRIGAVRTRGRAEEQDRRPRLDREGPAAISVQRGAGRALHPARAALHGRGVRRAVREGVRRQRARPCRCRRRRRRSPGRDCWRRRAAAPSSR